MILLLDIVFGLFGLVLDGVLQRNPHDRMHPLYGIPRERVRAMKRTSQGRAELKRIRNH